MNIVEELRSLTAKLHVQVEWAKASQAEDPKAILQHWAELSRQIAQAGEVLREAQSETAHAEVKNALTEYRDCMQRLQEALPMIQSQLLARRSRLEPERAHAQAAAAWMERNKTTL